MSYTLAFGAVLVAACANDPVSVTGPESRTVAASVGQTIEIDLSNIGPGEFSSPPSVSNASVVFLDVSVVGPNVPAGPTQRFRFSARNPGTAVVRFERTPFAQVIEDTIVVRR